MSRIAFTGAFFNSAQSAACARSLWRSNGVENSDIRMESKRGWLQSVSNPSLRHHDAGDDFGIVIGPLRIGSGPNAKSMCPRLLLDEYRARGTSFLRELDSGFAFIVHDGKTGKTLFAVDRCAVYSLCYRQLDDDGVVVGRFADDVAEAIPDGDALSIQALFDYLYFHVIPAPVTIFASVRRLEGAQYGEIVNGQLTIGRYWEPDYHVKSGVSFDARAAQFRQLLGGAVEHDAAGESTGAFLSGGTDSSSVVGWLEKAKGKSPRAYSIGFDAEGYDEMSYARIAAKRFHADHREYYVTPADIVAGIPLVAQHYDQPFGNSSAVPAYYCAKKAAEDGIHVLLAGDGGDEIFGGNARYAKQKVFTWYDHVPGILKSALLEPIFLSGVMRAIPVIKKVGSYIEQAKLGLPARLETYNLLHRLGPANVLTDALLKHVDQHAPDRAQAEVYRRCNDRAQVNQLHAYDWKYTLGDADLPKVTHTCELAGCEVRFPMLSNALVEFANALPPDYKVKGVKLRWFFKEASKGFLPDEILTKSKHGFGLPFGTWLKNDQAMQQLARDSLSGLVKRNIIRQSFIDEVFSRRLQEHAGFYGEIIWILTVLEQWLRGHAPAFRIDT